MRDALTVGINTYQYLPKLKTPANDANAIATLLEQYGSFRVQRLPEVIREERATVGRRTPVTLPELESALIRLFKPPGSNVPQTALFYFSGHGIQRHAGIREGYLALSDSQPEAGAAGLSLFWLRRLLQESPVRQRIVILDCCHSGELLTFLEADPGARPGTDRMFMVACREYEAAYESLTSDHSIFTEAILSGLDPRCHAAGRVTNYSLTSGANRALQGQPQQPLFENSGGEILLTASSTQLRARSDGDDYCPYPGLAPFDSGHADYYFGREKLTRTLIDEVITRPLVTLIGPSGCGKSSLLRAGLMAQLRRGQAFPESDRWRVRLMVPGDRPLKQLAAAFIDPDSTGLERAEQLRRAEGFLQDGGPGLTQLLRGSLLKESASGLGPRPRFVLVIDQFEELFTLCHSDRSQAERRQMIDALLHALREAQSCFRVVVGLRADFLGRCLQDDALAAAMTPGLLRVLPLSYEQLKAAILKPAQKVNLYCEPHLVYAMLFDIVGAPGELPLLQYTLRQLWQQRQQNTLTQAAYTALDGVHGILHTRASQVFDHLSVTQQDIAKCIFLALTQLGDGTEDTRRRVAKSHLLQLAYAPRAIEETLEILVNEKLIITSHRDLDCSEGKTLEGHRETVDIAHEALIRRWPLLQGWLDENRDMLRRQRSLEQAATVWYQAGQPDHVEYLLQGSRLLDAEEFLHQPNYKPTRLVKQYVALSRATNQRSHWERRRLQFALPCIILMALVAGFSQYYGAARARSIQTAQLRQLQSREQAAIAQDLLDDPTSDPTTALLIGALALESAPTPAAQTSVRQALAQLPLQTLSLDSGPITQIAADAGQLAIASADDTIRLWSSRRRGLQRPNHRAAAQQLSAPDYLLSASRSPLDPEAKAVTHLAFSADGSALVAATESVTGSTLIRLWSTDGVLLHEQDIDSPVTALAVSPTGRWVAAATADSLLVWEPQNKVAELAAKPLSKIKALQFQSDTALVSFSGQTLHHWRLGSSPSLQETQQLEPPGAAGPGATHSSFARFSADASQIAVSSQEVGHLNIWQTSTGAVRTVTSSLGGDMACAGSRFQRIDRNHRYTATVVSDAAQRYLCVKPLEHPQSLAFRLDDAPTAIAFSEQGDYLLTGDVSGTVRIWSLGGGELPTIAAVEPVRWIRFQPQATLTQQGLQSIGVASDLNLISPPPGPARLVGVTDGGDVSYRVAAGLTALLTPSPPAAPAQDTADRAIATAPIAWSADGDQKLIPQGKTVHLKEVSSGEEFQLEHESDVLAAHFSQEGAWIVTVEASRATLWNTVSRQIAHRFEHDAEGKLTAAAADAKQGRFALGDNTGKIHLWDTAQGRLLARFQAHTSALSALALSPDGKSLASADRRGQASLWQRSTEDGVAQPLELAHGDSPFVQLAFSPTGDYLALLDQMGQIHLRVGRPEPLRQLSQDRAGRSLTARECRQHLVPTVDCQRLDGE